MSDSVESAGALGVAVKVIGTPAFIGIVAGALGFLWSWPMNKKEGFIRIAAAGIGSIFLGPPLLLTAMHFAPWLTREEVAPACYLIAGLPTWWVLAWVFRWLDARKDKSLEDVAADVVAGAKNVKEIL